MTFNHKLKNAQTDSNLENHRKRSKNLMYMNDTKLFAKSEKGLETQIQAVRIYN